MNATTLSGSIRAGSIRPRRAVNAPAAAPSPALLDAPALAPAPVLDVKERGGVWCVVDQDGATLAPCADEGSARTHAATLSRLSSLFRQKP